MSFVLWVTIPAIVTAITYAPSGIWLVLRKQPMPTDAINHAIPSGIIIATVATGTIQSPRSIVGATAMGTVVVLMAELLELIRLVSGDGPQGLVFPALSSIGVPLLNTRFSGVQIIESAVLVGGFSLTAFLPLKIENALLDPQHLWMMAGMLVLNIVYLVVLHIHLKLIASSPELVQATDVSAKRPGHLTALVVSVTITTAFNAAGTVLVVALMIILAAIARLLSHSIHGIYLITTGVTIARSMTGFWAAYALDAPTSSGLAFFYGIVCLVVMTATAITQELRTPCIG